MIIDPSPLSRAEVCSVVEGRANTRRVPMFVHFWVHPEEFGERRQAVLDLLARYPCDMQVGTIHMPALFRGDDPLYPDYAWLPYAKPDNLSQGGLDAEVALDDWGKLDEVLAHFPNPDFPALLEWMPAPDGRYRLGHWWFWLFERHWLLRGMVNALTDYYVYPEETHRLYRALTDFYCGIVTRCAVETPVDGLWISDDLGTQNNGFFSPAIFREFFKPYYREIFDTCHRHGLQAWMHSCGCIREFIPDLIDAGLDVLHPIQKHTMDERAIAREFGDRLTIFIGLDVQQVIPWGTPDEVRAEVRNLLDTCWQPGKGRCVITAGNGINGDCTLASLEAFLDECLRYGAEIVDCGMRNAE